MEKNILQKYSPSKKYYKSLQPQKDISSSKMSEGPA